MDKKYAYKIMTPKKVSDISKNVYTEYKKYYLENHNTYLRIVNCENNIKRSLKINYGEDINIVNENISNDNLDEKENIKKFWFYGCLGIIKAEDINYLAVISGADINCYLFNYPIYKINSVSFFQLNENDNNKNCEYEVYNLNTNGKLTKKNDNKNIYFCNRNFEKSYNLFDSKNFLFEKCYFKCNKFNYCNFYVHQFKNVTLKRNSLKILLYFSRAFNKGPFYFSYYYNLTKSLQNQYLKKKYNENSDACNFLYNCDKLKFEDMNKDYIWNWKLLNKFEELKESNFILFLIHGCITSKVMNIQNTNVTLYLISRKNKNRSGVRLWCRGADQNGDVANFVESEQIVICNNLKEINVFSYIFIRGSIPVIWKQEPNLRLKPAIKVYNDMNENKNVLELHMKKLHKIYGGLSIVSLINKKHAEKELGECFQNCLKESSIKHNYTWFDFHTEFKNLNSDNLDILLENVVKDIKKFLYFSFSLPYISKNDTSNFNENYKNIIFNNVKINNYQNGIFRVNCIDCLDRTNVFQSFLAKYILFIQLESINITLHRQKQFPFFYFQNIYDEITFRQMWIKNANTISIIYTGAGALINDITKNGRRTIKGLYNDLRCVLIRYINGNFIDGYNDDCINIAINENLKYPNMFNIHKGNYNQLLNVLLEFTVIFSTALCTNPIQKLFKTIYYSVHNITVHSFSHFINSFFYFIKNNSRFILFPLDNSKYLYFISILAKISGILSIFFMILFCCAAYIYLHKRRIISSPRFKVEISK